MNHPLNRWQAARQVEYLLRAAAWADSPGERVLGWAAVSDLPVEAVFQYETVPFALVRPGSGDPEPQVPDLATVLRMDVDLVTVGMTDMEAASALVGGSRVSAGGLTHQGTSQGRGLYELEEVVRAALTGPASSLGMQCACTVGASGVPLPLQDGQYCAVSKLQLEVYNAGRARYYAPPEVLTAAGAGGTATLTWALPPRRWDTLGGASPQLALYYQAGTTPPAYGAGTPVAVTAGATTKAVAVGAGTWSFSLFALYDETDNGSNERQSPAATATVAA